MSSSSAHFGLSIGSGVGSSLLAGSSVGSTGGGSSSGQAATAFAGLGAQVSSFQTNASGRLPSLQPQPQQQHGYHHPHHYAGAATRRHKFIRRLLNFRQMDFQFALSQVADLCFRPKEAYRNIYYHRQTKNQWARDDPAFMVVLITVILISAICFSLRFSLGVGGFFKFFLWSVFVDFLGTGLVIATCCWAFTNRFMRTHTLHGVEQSVEWAYAFDVHCNAFLPLLLILHVLQLVLLTPFIMNTPDFFSALVCNTLWLVALTYYTYITYLGYAALPFLERTVYFLYPVALSFISYIISLLIGWNITRSVFRFYELEF
ncbi:hypothetical protein CAOG_07323 [Capsaspora owczarzaki ATCC 30864]|uniref:Unc-50 family protein n=1 Tax=Capsaspora owczarzaki (strain ATCC 30864) TaxID=595528 RepID=A0A0D2WXH8_CAPO3|nr:hypothetical protein CAOG_07323 [Capsaspora owczarzaki ATCC 30864]KJE97468.1 hypothetical protein CAOG_007323 [Capsaspora owczarzaki ATCC 30864]|eukprot:XP_004343182.1 hypothetical protein CAOG_07323 [Capsaspora owczarzaki ATCC 30864]